jgi:hypothetical protein
VATTFRTTIAALHRSKDAAYGDSWKRRGEQISIMANIARKVDRLGVLAATGEAATTDENAIDTAVDLLVYAMKYQTYLADLDPDVLPDVLPPVEGGTGWSNRADGFERVLNATDLSGLDAQPGETLSQLITAAESTFSTLERCFSSSGATAPAAERARLAAALAADAVRIVARLRATSPALYDGFIATWHQPPADTNRR